MIGKPAFRNRLVVLANIAIFAICAMLGFWRNLVALFDSQDGLYVLIESRQRLGELQPLFSFTNNFLQSIGNIQVLQNPRLLFYLWPLGWFSNVYVAEIAVYVLIGVAVFLSAYVMGRQLGQDRMISLIAGWILGILAPPIIPLPFFYSILSSSPAAIVLIIAPVIGFALIRWSGRTTLAGDFLAGVGLLGLVLYILSTNPGVVMVLAPAAVPYVALAIVLSEGRHEIIRKLVVLTVVAVLVVALKWPWFLLGIFSYTAASVFPNDFTIIYREAVYVSVMFHFPMFGWPGPALVAMAVLGAALNLRPTPLRGAAIVLLASIAGLLACLAVMLAVDGWILPPPIYTEMSIWPLYAVFAAMAVSRCGAFLSEVLLRSSRFGTWVDATEWLLPVPAVLFVAVASLSRSPIYSGVDLPRAAPLVDVLKDEIALRPPTAEFRGRVATIIPVDERKGDPWSQQFMTTLPLWRMIGNDHMSLGLWDFWIPTLFEYNQFSSPMFHALVKKSLQRPVMKHYRNITVISYANERILKLLGVRFVLMPHGASTIGDERAFQESAGQKWGLFELKGANLATYSPTVLEVRRDLSSTLDALADESIDLTRTAIVRDAIDQVLVPARTQSFSTVQSDQRLMAQSDGTSLVIVPLEFSHCIELRDGRGFPLISKARLVRVDGLLTGVLFEREIDAVLSFRTGPLVNPTCRWQDFKDLRSMMP